jgi:TonB family protein
MLRYYIHWLAVLSFFGSACDGRAQSAPRKTIAFYSEKHQLLSSSQGASYAVETEFVDSLRAIETVYWAPNKVREVAHFSNIRRRLREGETIVYHNNGGVKRQEQYRYGFRQGDGFTYYPSGKLRSQDRFEGYKRVSQACFDEEGNTLDCDTLAKRTLCPALLPVATTSAYVRYPAKALKANIEGVVKVKFVISRFGQLVDAWVLESPSPLLSIEAIAAVRRVKWGIFQCYCDPMDEAFIIPFTFNIE